MAGLTGPALVILGTGSLAAARRLQGALPDATLWGLATRVGDADRRFDDFGATVRQLYADDTPIIAFCAAGIVIRALAGALHDKRAEPPVIAVAEDGSAVVPLLGGLRGVNGLARAVGAALGTAPAITTTGEVRFAATLETPPDGYALRNPQDTKRFMSDLLAGARVRVIGDAPWLADTKLPIDPEGTLAIVVTPRDAAPAGQALVFHPRSIAVAVTASCDEPARRLADLLACHGLSALAVGAVIAAEHDAAQPAIHAAAATQPLRLVAAAPTVRARDLVAHAVPTPVAGPFGDDALAVAVAAAPLAVETIGRARGSLAVVGLGPGAAGWLAPDARRAIAAADDVVGYATYVEMAGPFAPTQAIHASDNREELQRARHALALAGQGRAVVVVSSGDPGIFAMAAAVMEALDGADDPAWHGIALSIVPGISAAQAAAARAGAPLGHDFCVLSLSDNLKPWAVIADRLEHAAAADLVIALYNPASRARPSQFARAAEILARHRAPETPVILGRDVGRPGETVRVIALSALASADIDMRTVVIVGASTTTTIPRADGKAWVYTPRSYGKPES